MTTVPNVFVLLGLRWIQLRRAVPPFGIMLLALALVILVWLLQKAVVRDASYGAYIAGALLLAVWGMHQRRLDLHFLHRHVPNPRLVMALEYAALALPVLLGLLLAHAWTCAAMVPVVGAFPWVPVVRTSGVRGGWLRKRLPIRLFEWKSAVQRTHPFGLLLWLAAMTLCWLPMLPLFLLWFIGVLICGMHEDCEPRSMLLATAPNAEALLRTKTIGAVKLMTVIVLPVLIGATVFQPQWWWVHLLFGLGQIALVVLAVTLKYSNYIPNERLSANGAVITTAAVFAILPGLFVVPLIMLLTERRKALDNLHYRFHDHHR
ncbi:MAG: hypothetical protein ABI432_13665 [Flavobacteriales bacterium]